MVNRFFLDIKDGSFFLDIKDGNLIDWVEWVPLEKTVNQK